MITVALVDDHVITRKGIKSVIELHPEIKVVHEAANGKQLMEQLPGVHIPDILILDINMPEMNGFETIRAVQRKFPSIKIIVFSLICEEDAVINMITSGACGYITKSADPSSLATVITTVYETGIYVSELVKKEYFKYAAKTKIKPGFNGAQYLSPKELEFIKLSTSNLSYKEIAEILEVSPKTIENYRDSLFQKLNIHNRAALALYGFKNGLINTCQ